MARTATTEARPLVTVIGASGFVGSAITAALARRPIRLRAVARRPSVIHPNVAAEVEVCTADVTNANALAESVAGSDAVIHLVAHIAGAGTWRVAESDPAGERVNVGIMRDLVGVLRRNHRSGPPPVVLFAGTTAQVGLPATELIDGTEPDGPETAYDRQKLAAEQVLKSATAEGVLRGVSLRLPTVFGHGINVNAVDRGVVATMVRRALAGEPLTIWHDGTVERDLLYVHDAAEAFLAALDHADSLAGCHWVIGTGNRNRLGDVFRAIAEIVSERTEQPPVPVVSVEPPAHATATDFRSVAIDSSAFRAITSWYPRVSLSEALNRIVTAALSDASSGGRRIEGVGEHVWT